MKDADGYDPADNSTKCYDLAIRLKREKLESFQKVEIGDCTLYRADAREIVPLLPAVDFIFTDPPYGHNNNNGDLIHRREAVLGLIPNGGSNPRAILNDGKEEAKALIEWFFSSLPSLLRPGSCCCCCGGGGGPDPQFARWSLEIDKHLDFKQMVVWDKGPMGMGWHYRRSYETVLVAQKPGAACKWYDDTDRIENIIRPGYLGIRKVIPQANDHPTPKPVELPRHFIRLHSAPGDIVMDPFMGGGSTAIAAINEGRKFIGIELDNEHFERSCRRIEKAYLQPDMFTPEPIQPKPEQITMELAP